MDVVVVESPTKAKTINKYLGSNYTVLSSYGHVRDLPEKDGSVLPDDDFHMVYEVLSDKKKRIDEIAKAVRSADRLYLATDPDREGEAISWHLLEALNAKKVIKNTDVKRVVFHEITKNAVLKAIANPRELDKHLIDAYQARRALDYLVGFNLSPVLWRKLQGSKSAGRVQSVALRLISEREAEIEAFIPQEYWTIEALLANAKGDPFKARLAAIDGKKLGKFDLADEASAKAATSRIEGADFTLGTIEKKQVGRNPSPPFSTSTLQQEAARKLNFSTDQTMKVAQRLFEGVTIDGDTVGLITYMRTDSVQISNDAIASTRKLVGSQFGNRYLPSSPRQFKTKTKNAQEAHEAIRPTDLFRAPDRVSAMLDRDQAQLYALIWKRTVASQMAAAVMDRVSADVEGGGLTLRATGQTVAFDGFLKLYQEGRDDPGDDDDRSGLLPPLQTGERATKKSVTPNQHFTQPPPRFAEASLVKKLEELGIGRPSTYASIISVLQARDYVNLESKRFQPTDRGRLVSAFLAAFFDRYVQPGFTASLEGDLDGIAAGDRSWKTVLREFWDPFHSRIEEVQERRVAEVIDALNVAMETKLFPPREDGKDRRACPLCDDGELSLKLGRYGAFIGCSRYPDCRFTRKLDDKPGEAEDPAAKDRVLGVDPANDEEVRLRVGRFGPYLQLGSGSDVARSSLPPNHPPESIDLGIALQLLALPREVGIDPESQKPIMAGINRYGPFVQLERKFVRLQDDDDVLTIGMNRAVALLAEAKPGRQAKASTPLRELGAHPEDGEPMQILDGRYGPYVKHGKVNASLPKSSSPETITMAEAVELLKARLEKMGSKGRTKKAAPKRAPAKTTKAKTTKAKTTKAKKPAAKKPAAKTSTTEKSTVKKPAGD